MELINKYTQRIHTTDDYIDDSCVDSTPAAYRKVFENMVSVLRAGYGHGDIIYPTGEQIKDIITHRRIIIARFIYRFESKETRYCFKNHRHEPIKVDGRAYIFVTRPEEVYPAIEKFLQDKINSGIILVDRERK